jgi:hypothetical protein
VHFGSKAIKTCMVNKPDWFARALQALCMFCAKLKVELDVLIPGMKH